MIKTLKLGTLALLAAVPAVYAQDVTYDWTLTGSVTGSGTLTVNPTYFATDDTADPPFGIFTGSSSEYDYSVDSFSGSISGIGTVAEYPFENAIGLYSATLPSSTFSPDASIFTYLPPNGSGQYVIYQESGSGTIFGSAIDYFASGETFTLSPEVSVVPELPLNPGLVAVAGLLVSWRSWRSLRPARA